MRNKKTLIILILALAFLSACTEIFEVNIENETVQLVAPADSIVTCNNLHTFIWEEIEGAINYNLRIVSPDFNSLESIILDTTVSETQFSYSLVPGDYQWGVKATNNNYETEYSIRNIHVDTTYDFAQLQILLTSPAGNFATNSESVNFSWSSLSGAELYYYEVRENDWQSGELILSGSTSDSELNLNLSEGSFYWGIRAFDEYSGTTTPFSYRKVIVDLSNPINSVPTYPMNNDTVYSDDLISGQIIFTWTRSVDTGSELSDSVCIFRDSDLENIVIRSKTTSSSFYYSPTEFGDYFWYLRTFDAAGNISDFSISQIRKFRYEE